jgi:hypothetical protein
MHPSWPGGTLLLSIVEPGDNPWKWLVENLTEKAGETNAVAALVPDVCFQGARTRESARTCSKKSGSLLFFRGEHWELVYGFLVIIWMWGERLVLFAALNLQTINVLNPLSALKKVCWMAIIGFRFLGDKGRKWRCWKIEREWTREWWLDARCSFSVFRTIRNGLIVDVQSWFNRC